MLSSLVVADIDLLSLFILACIRFTQGRRPQSCAAHDRVFTALINATGFLLLMDAITVTSNGLPGALPVFLNHASTAVMFAAEPVPGLLWLLYIYLRINDGRETAFRHTFLLFALPAAANLLLTTINLQAGFFYQIDGQNVYHRGQWIVVHAILSFLSMPCSMAYPIYLRRQLERRHLAAMLAFSVLPSIGILVQCFFYGLSTVWPSAALAVLTVFLNVQRQQLQVDYLTGVYNRRELDRYLAGQVANAQDRPFGAILLDLDNFKQINDTYGHLQGDETLREAARLMKSCLSLNDFIARYGGDEFVLVVNCPDQRKLDEIVENLADAFAAHNQNQAYPWKLSISMGYALYPVGLSPEKYLQMLDLLMYEDKRKEEKAPLLIQNSLRL